MQRFLAGIVIILVALIYFVYNFYYSVNFPYQDDYLLIQFIETISQGGSGVSGVIKELFRTFNDHKAAVPRFVSLVNYHLTGYLDYRAYIVIVSVNVCYIFGFLYLQFRKLNLPPWYFLPAAFLFFQPLYHEISNWALTGLQHSFLTAFTVTAIMLVSRRTSGAFLGAMFCCFLATFTHGNGILSFPAIIFFFLCIKDFRGAIMTALFMIGCFLIYIIGYESGQAGKLPTSVISFLSSLFGFVGSSMSLWSAPVLWSAVWGIVIVAFVAFIVTKIAQTYYGKPLVIKPGTVELISLFAFIFITSFVVALFRSWAGSTIASRFQIYASLATVIFYLLLLSYTSFFRRMRVVSILIGLSVFYWIYSYYKFTEMIAAQKTVYLADVYNWKTNHNMFSVEKSILRNADFYLTPAYQKGFFRIPRPVVEKAQLDSMFAAQPLATADHGMYVEEWKVDRLSRDTTELLTFYFVSSVVEPERKGFTGNRFMVLKDRTHGQVHLVSANPKVEARREILTSGNYYKPGFNVLFRIDDLAPGNYDLGILDVSDKHEKTFYRLDKALLVTTSRIALQ
ncbi:hypothetical protein [Dyadobacter sp. Leaf189]|uniref:hypothetical protein n=1 Tax=Dyadobacter sp. Leaf189 TaxID=1736295 RepID=UPI0006F6FBEC|nr:hypothetical protein [Dyadobacter sp. Leaf189]KQS33616.1 hypothetical protein ASG33_06010 [Dyadobacter sp. Leaf189]